MMKNDWETDHRTKETLGHRPSPWASKCSAIVFLKVLVWNKRHTMLILSWESADFPVSFLWSTNKIQFSLEEIWNPMSKFKNWQNQKATKLKKKKTSSYSHLTLADPQLVSALPEAFLMPAESVSVWFHSRHYSHFENKLRRRKKITTF